MKDILVVVDVQNDFITGSLGSESAIKIIPNIKKLLKDFKGEIIFTKDTHYSNYLETLEGKKLPVIHCIENTDGWNIHDDIKSYANKIFIKNTFGSKEAMEYLSLKDDINKLIFVGICTDICVISNALLAKAYMPNTEIYVIENCCAGSSILKHKEALSVMQSCQVNIVYDE